MDLETSVTLCAGKLQLVLSPSIGGSISAFDWNEDGRLRHLLWNCNGSLQNVLDAGSFPLVPYVNRIRDGRFSFRGQEVVLSPNMPGDPSPLHGQGWLNPWQVAEAGESEARLLFNHQAAEWPWSYAAEQVFALDPGGLSIRLSCQNTSDTPMPCGLGQHPYFPCGPQTLLDTEVETAWTIDEQVLPVAEVPAEGDFDLRDRSVCGQKLDHGFGGWGGSALMTDPDWPYVLRMSSPDARFFQLYSPPEGGIFVAEPVSHANAALNAPEDQWPRLGMRVLEPGDTMSLDMRLDIDPK